MAKLFIGKLSSLQSHFKLKIFQYTTNHEQPVGEIL